MSDGSAETRNTPDLPLKAVLRGSGVLSVSVFLTGLKLTSQGDTEPSDRRGQRSASLPSLSTPRPEPCLEEGLREYFFGIKATCQWHPRPLCDWILTLSAVGPLFLWPHNPFGLFHLTRPSLPPAGVPSPVPAPTSPNKNPCDEAPLRCHHPCSPWQVINRKPCIFLRTGPGASKTLGPWPQSSWTGQRTF